jgi:hypothetical protein
MLQHIRQLSTWLKILTIGGLLAAWAVGVRAQQTNPSDCERLAQFLEEKGLLSAQDLATLNHRVEASHEQWVTHWSNTRVPPSLTMTSEQLAEFLKEKGLLSTQDLASFERGTGAG